MELEVEGVPVLSKENLVFVEADSVNTAGLSLTTLLVVTSFSLARRAGARPAGRARGTAGTSPPSPTRPPTTSSSAWAAHPNRPGLGPRGRGGHGPMARLGATRTGMLGNLTMLAAMRTMRQ